MLEYMKIRLSMILEEKKLKREMKLAEKEDKLESLRHQTRKRWEKTIQRKENYDNDIIDYNDPAEESRSNVNDSWWKEPTIETKSVDKDSWWKERALPPELKYSMRNVIRERFSGSMTPTILNILSREHEVYNTFRVGNLTVTLVRVQGANIYTLNGYSLCTAAGAEIINMKAIVPSFKKSTQDLFMDGHNITVARMDIGNVYIFVYGDIVGPVDPGQGVLKLELNSLKFNIHYVKPDYSEYNPVTIEGDGTISQRNGDDVIVRLLSAVNRLREVNPPNNYIMYASADIVVRVGHSYREHYTVHLNRSVTYKGGH